MTFTIYVSAAQQLQSARCSFSKNAEGDKPIDQYGNNWKEAKTRVRLIHEWFGNSFRDYLQKDFVRDQPNHSIACIENLQVRNKPKLLAGVANALGKNVRAKFGLNESILDQGLLEFCCQMDYKESWQPPSPCHA